MSYGFALPVGVSSVAEYGDFRFAEDMEASQFMDCYNKHLPKGFQVLAAEELQEGAASLMSEINAASWEIVLPGKSAEDVEQRWGWLQSVDSFVVERETKKGTRSVNIRPLLLEVAKISPSPQGTVIHCFTAVGNEGNLRIEELGQLLDFSHLGASITRTGQFNKVGNHYRPPLGN
jgi:radical SAM-linked protein